jgi:hypothetical protein
VGARDRPEHEDEGEEAGRGRGGILEELYYRGWIDTYGGRTSQGLSETTRDEYRRVAVKWLLPRWETWKLIAVEPKDVRALLIEMRDAGASTSEIKKTRTAGSAMYGTASEDDGIGPTLSLASVSRRRLNRR